MATILRSPTRSRSAFFGLLLLCSQAVTAHEGMWLPTLLKGIESDLHTAGLRITAEDIYSVNRGSIKDAIVLFGGGCTAEVIGTNGLILTNHHCGFSQITAHSTVENDRLKNGYWAADHAAELRNPELTATFVVRMEDVTARIMDGLAKQGDIVEAQRRRAVEQIAKPIIDEAVKGTHYRAVVRPFNYGNSYYLIVTETFRDVRLVGAPPSAIGKFGGDTDNWMWPRHNADFALFRIYAGPDNKPADPSDANVPFKPRHVLPIAFDGPQEGEFAMIFGFPGNTQRYLSSYGVEYVVEKADPLRIAMRTASLAEIDAAMRSSDRLRLMYADKQASISNAWKKWIGELRGLRELNTLANKRAYEDRYRARAAETGAPHYAASLDALRDLYGQYVPYATARDLFIELFFYGPDILRFTDGFKDLLSGHAVLRAEGKLPFAIDERLTEAERFFAGHDMEVDKRILKALVPLYRQHVPAAHLPAVLNEIDTRHKGDIDAWADALYARSVFTDPQRLRAALRNPSTKNLDKLVADPMYRLVRGLMDTFLEQVRPAHAEFSDRIERAMRTYVAGMMEMFPEKTYWPDANSTLRLSYGKVEGSEPRDAVVYGPFTTLDGVMEKYVPGDVEFDVPQRLIDLWKAKDYGPYGRNGTLPVCFTSSLHTTGGNSGSPVLNGDGHLIGLNFDRTWESTMSDIQFDPEKCRNICVDVRYILFLIDKYADAGHLMQEMNLVHTGQPHVIPLPIHR
jgi:hypothetical protein